MKLKFILIGLLYLFGQSLYGQGPDLGSFGYRLVKTVEDADFDYQRLESYFSDKTRLNAPDTDAQAIFEPIKGYYTFYIFLGDLLSEVVDDTLRAYYPAAIDKQQMLVVKAEDSRVITDGFLFPYTNRDLPLSESLFRVRTKDFQLKKRFSLEKLNFRNLYNKGLRAEGGIVYVPEDVFWPYNQSDWLLEPRFNLVKKVVNADFNYSLLDNAKRYDEELEKKGLLVDYEPNESAHKKQGRRLLRMLEPVAGEFIYYQFIADVVVGDIVLPQYDHHRDSFDKLLEAYEATDDHEHPMVLVRNVLILKTDTSGLIVDGFGSPVDLIHLPASNNLMRIGRQGVRLRDGLSLHELKLNKDYEPYGFFIDKGKIFLFPK